MCMNKKIRSELNFSAKKPGGLVLDELNRGRQEVLNQMRPEVLNQLLTLVQDRPTVPESGLTKKTHWYNIKHRIEREDEENRS